MTSPKSKKLIVEESLTEKLERWYDRNGMILNVCLGVVLAGVLGFYGYKWMNERAVRAANMDLSPVVQRFSEAMGTEDDAKKNEQLDAAVTAANEVVEKHKGNKVGREAQMMIANAQYDMAVNKTGQDVAMFEKARDSFQKAVDMSETKEEKAAGLIGKGNVLENLAFIQENPKLLEDAIAVYKEAQTVAAGTYLGGEAKLNTARALLAQNNDNATADAKKLYEEVSKDRSVTMTAEHKKDSSSRTVKTATGAELSQDEVQGLLNSAVFSQKKQAEDQLAGLN